MENNKLIQYLPADVNYKDSINCTNSQNRVDYKMSAKNYNRNFSQLTTKTDENFEKNIFIDKKTGIYSTNQNSNLNDESIIKNLKSKGLLDKSLEFKFDEYKSDMKITVKKEKNLSKMELLNEIYLINKNLHIANIEKENLLHLKKLKDKKIDIYENSISKVKKKLKNFKNLNENKSPKYISEQNSIKNCNLNNNWKNVLIQHYEIFSYDLIKRLSLNSDRKDLEKLEEVSFVTFLRLKTNLNNEYIYSSNLICFNSFSFYII